MNQYPWDNGVPIQAAAAFDLYVYGSSGSKPPPYSIDYSIFRQNFQPTLFINILGKITQNCRNWGILVFFYCILKNYVV